MPEMCAKGNSFEPSMAAAGFGEARAGLWANADAAFLPESPSVALVMLLASAAPSPLPKLPTRFGVREAAGSFESKEAAARSGEARLEEEEEDEIGLRMVISDE